MQGESDQSSTRTKHYENILLQQKKPIVNLSILVLPAVLAIYWTLKIWGYNLAYSLQARIELPGCTLAVALVTGSLMILSHFEELLTVF